MGPRGLGLPGCPQCPIALQRTGVYTALAGGSSLINTARPVCSPRDQRGAIRPDACDKGAVEFGGLLPRIFAPLLRK
jgi:hypothetical protein